MATETKQLSFFRPIVVMGSLTLVVAALYVAQKIVIPVALALFLTFLLAPLVSALQRRKVPRLVAVLLAVALFLAILAGTSWLITAQIHDLLARLPEHRQNITHKLSALQSGDDSVLARFSDMISTIAAELQHKPSDQSGQPIPVVVQNDNSLPLSQVPSIAGYLLEMLASAALVLVLVVFMLMKREDLRFRLIQLVGHDRLTLTNQALDEAGEGISRFLLMQLAINVAFGLCLFVTLAVLGVPYAFLWGFIAALLRFVPYIGTWLALVFPLALSIAVFPSWFQPLAVFASFLAIEVLAANVAEPLLFSHSTGVSPIALLLAAVFWTWLWGPIGLILAAPLTVCLNVMARYVPPLGFLHILLGDHPVVDPPVQYYERLLARDQDGAEEVVEEYLRTQPPENVYDRVLVPALALARRDRLRGALRLHQERTIQQGMGELLDELALPREKEDGTSTSPAVSVLGCPASDKVDEMALHMLRNLLGSHQARLTVVSTKKLAGEMLEQVRDEQLKAVCIGAVAPGGLAKARYLCKRLRAAFPDLPILVGRWGHHDTFEHAMQRLKEAGANYVAPTLLETCNQLLPILRLHSPVARSATQPDRPAVQARA